MSTFARQADTAPESTPPEPLRGRLVGWLRSGFTLLSRLRGWAGANRARGALMAATILLLIAATIGGWAYLARLALRNSQPTLASALERLDQHRFEEARGMVGRMLRGGYLPRSEYGGPLFVLGAIKTNDAENNHLPDRRRIDYLVASRYLKEARAHGFPAGREQDALFLLGLSLLESNQFEEGTQTLDELLAGDLAPDEPLAYEAHRLLAEMCLYMPRPDLNKSLLHNDAVLRNPQLSSEDRADCLLQRADCLARLHRFDEARETVVSLPREIDHRSGTFLLQGRITLDELETASQNVASDDREKLIEAWKSKTAEAIQQLKQAESLDGQVGYVGRQASYHIGRGLVWQGEKAAAREQFTRTRQLYPDTLEALAAGLAEADLLRQEEAYQDALLAYRRVLESSTSAATYRSDVLPLEELRVRILAAVADFVDHHKFDEALTLLSLFPPMFSRAEQLGIQGDTLQQWGNLLLSQAADESSQPSDQRTAALQHLRSAGLAFEQLAELRFSTKAFTDDLWRSAENYYQGHSFSRTIQQLIKYLKHEPELRNAQALLRLGQAHLALGQIADSITSLEECIELHPLDSSTYQARVDAAKAYRYQGNTTRAEQLLKDNINGSTLKPSSREWKDSLFELGMLLHETGQHEQAISTLEEAVDRYPDDPQSLLAKYLMGESYRRWADELLNQLPQTRIASERKKNVQLADTRLEAALQHFEDVQRSITLRTHDAHPDPLMRTMLRNCYMLEGTVLFDLGSMTGEKERYKEAIEAYSNVSSLYPDEPFVLETFVQIANCWRRLGRDDTARLTIKQAQIALDRLAAESDFSTATSFSRDEWRMLLSDMSRW